MVKRNRKKLKKDFGSTHLREDTPNAQKFAMLFFGIGPVVLVGLILYSKGFFG